MKRSGPRKVFHVVSFCHNDTTSKYVACAYTEKYRKFCNMMTSLGHTVYLYGAERTEARCSEFIPCFSAEDKQKYLKPDTIWIGQTEAFRVMNERVIAEIRNRQHDKKDFICTMAGTLHKPIADALPHLSTVEIGIGYSGVFSRFKIFESYAWMHVLYGAATGGDASKADGNYYDCVIPNFYEPEDFPFSAIKEDYYLYMGRLTSRKGIQIPADVCKTLGKRLIIAGGEGSPMTYGEYVGIVDAKTRGELMSKAKAIFTPTQYIGPFEGTHAEAMLCGTPVISSDWGVFAETNVHGVTGFRCRTYGEYIQAAQNVDKLDPIQIMQYAVDNFATDNVRWKYEAYFDQLLDLWEDGFYSKRQHSYNRYGQIYDLEPADSDSFIRHDLPLVSCYCPTYGRAHCLEEAIECFLKQDYQGPKELVILNDYADQELVYDHPEVRIINVKERIKPLGRKFNETIKHCKGEVLFCWDDDDIFLPNRISYSLKKMERGVFYTRSGFSEDAEEQYSLFHPTAVAHSTHAFRREVFDAVGGYPETDHVAVDQYFIQKVRDHLGGDYFQKTNNEDIFYIYRWGSIGSYHTSDCASETHNVSDQVEIKLARQKADGSIPTGVINLSPKWKYNYDCVAKAFFKPKMNHIWMNPNFGEPWFSYPNLYTQFVNETPNGGTIVEVGSWKGKSTAYLGVEVINSGKDIRVYAVDTWLGSPNEDVHQNDPAVKQGQLYDLFVDNMAPINKSKQVVIWLRSDSVEASKDFGNGSIDCVFIDASHDYDNVKKDITAYLPKVKSGGILAGHDWSWHGVRKAVQELLPNAVPTNEDCWFYRVT